MKDKENVQKDSVPFLPNTLMLIIKYRGRERKGGKATAILDRTKEDKLFIKY